MASKILFKLSETYPEVLTTPQTILGPNYPKVLEFWRRIDILSEPEMKEIGQRYWALDSKVRNSAWVAASNVAEEVVCREFSLEAWWVALNVTGWEVFSYATWELVGNLDNKVFYDLIMSYKES